VSSPCPGWSWVLFLCALDLGGLLCVTHVCGLSALTLVLPYDLILLPAPTARRRGRVAVGVGPYAPRALAGSACE
jgi:hypothetical protein